MKTNFLDMKMEITTDTFPLFRTLSGIVADITETEIPLDENVWVLTNASGQFGASLIMETEIMDTVCRALNSSVIILPSSIHEVIILKDDGYMKDEELNQMVREVNETQVVTEERLSDHVYHYSIYTGWEF